VENLPLKLKFLEHLKGYLIRATPKNAPLFILKGRFFCSKKWRQLLKFLPT